MGHLPCGIPGRSSQPDRGTAPRILCGPVVLRCRSRLGGQHELDRLADGIDGAIQVGPTARHLNIRFIHPPGPIRVTHLAANSLIQNERITLHLSARTSKPRKPIVVLRLDPEALLERHVERRPSFTKSGGMCNKKAGGPLDERLENVHFLQ